MLWLELSVTDSLMRVRFFRQTLHHSQQTFRIYPAAHQLSMAYNHRGHPSLTVEPLTGHISFPSSRYVFPEMPTGVSGWCDVCVRCVLADCDCLSICDWTHHSWLQGQLQSSAAGTAKRIWEPSSSFARDDTSMFWFQGLQNSCQFSLKDSGVS